MFNDDLEWEEAIATAVTYPMFIVQSAEVGASATPPKRHSVMPAPPPAIFRDLARLEHQLAATHDILDALRQENEDLRREVATHRAWNVAANVALGKSERENADMRARLPETPDYHGPTKDGKAVADPVHERVHEVVKDVLAGRVIPAARKQLQGALDKAPKDAAAGPDFTRNFGKDPRRLGMA